MKTIVLTVAVLIFCEITMAQSITPQVINSTGGTYKKGYYSFDWSVGELALVDEMKGTNNTYIITNGFLQSNTETPDRQTFHGGFTRDEIIILPNPTAGKLEINFSIAEPGEAKVVLYDAVGGQLITRRVQLYGYGKFERLDLTGMPGSTYLLAIDFSSSTGKIRKKGTYKIVKIQ